MEYSRRSALALAASVLLGALTPSRVAADTNLPIGGQAQVFFTDGDGVRVREKPSVASDTLKVLEEGWRVTVLQGPVNGDGDKPWYRVAHTGTVGYILAQYLVTATGETGGIMPGEPASVFTDDGAPLRLREAADGPILLTMPHGATVTVQDGPTMDRADHRWYKLTYQGTAGWALGAYLRPVEVTTARRANPAPAQPAASAAPQASAPAPAPAGDGSAAARVVALARDLVGAPYAWGGTTPDGFDCSGFTQYVMARAAGVHIGRDVYAQFAAGHGVSADDLQPGDLVFQKNTYRWGLSHVGIYVGDGYMINAQSESTGVRAQYLWDGYWGPRFYGARRVT